MTTPTSNPTILNAFKVYREAIDLCLEATEGLIEQGDIGSAVKVMQRMARNHGLITQVMEDNVNAD